jgi:hypothetical protein
MRLILLMLIFYLVTWRDQERPFFYVLACKTRKTRWGLAGEASSDDQVSPVSKEDGEEERANNRYCPNDFFTPFYIPACYMSILPLSSAGLHVDVLYLP